jgi:hypothetical protein
MLNRLLSILHRRNYIVYTRPYELNIIGLRSANTKANRFDDEIHVLYKNNIGIWNHHVFNATTDPGTYWLMNPMQPQGTAILAQGQYVHAYELGLHRGQYLALVQRLPVIIIRDYDRNAILDFRNGIKAKGNFGINIHRAMFHGDTLHVDNWSAGCQVFENGEDYIKFMQLCNRHRNLYDNRFTYTLIDFREIKRETNRRILIGAGTFLFGMMALTALNYDKLFKTNITRQKSSVQHT